MAAKCRPEAEDHASGLKETDLVVGLASSGPAERLVEATRSGKVGYAQRYKTDPLLHWSS